MGSASISGLASGLDTASIISQLMQLEALPQSRLKTQITTHQSALTKLQELNTKLAALATKAADLGKTTAWTPMTVTSTDNKVSITASNAAPGQLTFTVLATAKAHTLSFNTSAALTDVVVTGATKNIKIDMLDGTTSTVNTGTGTLQEVIDAINGSGKGLRATTILLNDGKYRLRVESTTTGAASDFAITQAQGNQTLLGGSTVVTAGTDAQIKIGNDTINSTTNTFTNVLPGVSITLGVDAVPGTPVTATFATDTKTMSDTVKALVDQLNAVLTDIDAATATGGGTGSSATKAGVLAGDSRLRALRDALVNTLYSSAGTGLSTVGVQLDRNGKFVYDEAKFKAAYQANPAGTTAQFTTATSTGFVDRLAQVTKAASQASGGTISQAITGRKSIIDQLEDGVAAWDQRLELRRKTLTQQFTALETALSRMNSQSNWLAGQIASLPTSSS